MPRLKRLIRPAPTPVPAPKKKGLPPAPRGTGKKTQLLKDTIKKAESYHDALEREVVGSTNLAAILDDETGEAHQLYLMGRGGRRPIRDLEKLSSMTGVPLSRLKVLAPAWRKEAMRLAREASPLFAMAATAKARSAHFKDLDSMRKRIERFEELLPDTDHPTFPAKYRFLMDMRREWQDASGVSAAIEISKVCMITEAKALLSAPPKEEDGDYEDLSAFDVDGEVLD